MHCGRSLCRGLHGLLHGRAHGRAHGRLRTHSLRRLTHGSGWRMHLWRWLAHRWRLTHLSRLVHGRHLTHWRWRTTHRRLRTHSGIWKRLRRAGSEPGRRVLRASHWFTGRMGVNGSGRRSGCGIQLLLPRRRVRRASRHIRWGVLTPSALHN